MTRFAYVAKDWSGKTIKGVLDMGSKEEVLSSVREAGLIPLTIDKEVQSSLDKFKKKTVSKVGLKQISGFTRQLSTMLTAGLPLTDALTLTKNQTDTNSEMFEMLDYTLNMVKGGRSLADGLSKYRKAFGDAYIASVEAGESGGVIEEVMSKLADNLEKENEFKGKVKGAMMYPIIVLSAMGIVFVVMMVFVIPKLMGMYSDFGTKMPAITQFMMDASSIMQKIWPIFPILVFVGVSAWKAADKDEKMKLKKDTFIIKMPILGEMTKKTIMANTTRTLAMLLGAGISIVDGLKIAAQVADNQLYKNSYLKISEDVQKGFSIASSFEESGVFPPLVNQMVTTGEATGKLGEVLQRVSDFFASEAEQSVKTLTTAIEPLIMIVLGIGVAFLVVAVVMPIYTLTSSFGG